MKAQDGEFITVNKTVKVIIDFYFDFSEPYSYLMLKELENNHALPLKIAYHPLDSAALRSLSALSFQWGEQGQNYKINYARLLSASTGRKFKAPEMPFNGGHALRAANAVLSEYPDIFPEFCSKLMTWIWGEGKTPDLPTLRACLDTFETLRNVSDTEDPQDFALRERRVREALSLGVFDVPFMIFGEYRFYGCVDSVLLKKSILSEWFSSFDKELLIAAASDLMSALPKKDFGAHLDFFVRHAEKNIEKSRDNSKNLSELPDKFTVVKPKSEIRLPCFFPEHDIKIHTLSQNTKITEYLQKNHAALSEGNRLILSLTREDVKISEFLTKINTLKLPDCGILIRQPKNMTILIFVSDAEGRFKVETFRSESKAYVQIGVSSWKIAVLRYGDATPSPIAARKAASEGNHVLVDSNDLSDIALSALAQSCERWLISFSGSFADASGDIIQDIAAVTWPPRLSPGSGKTPDFELPRSLLLHDNELKIGSRSSNAMLSLACLGSGLTVESPFEKLLWGETRNYGKISLSSSQSLLIVPVKNQQILAAEHVAYKIIDAIRDQYAPLPLLLVNYWLELKFDSLERLRSVLSLACEVSRIPLVLTVGTTVAEMWMPGDKSKAYRIESENGVFTCDMADFPISLEWASNAVHNPVFQSLTLFD